MNSPLAHSQPLLRKPHARAFSLVELLLVALAIGLLLISAAVAAYVRSRALFETTESVSRLQDAARYALSVMEPDIELAGDHGRSNTAANIRMVEHGRARSFVASAYDMRQAADTGVSQLGAAAHACGRNFAVDLLQVAQRQQSLRARPRRLEHMRGLCPGCAGRERHAHTTARRGRHGYAGCRPHSDPRIAIVEPRKPGVVRRWPDTGSPRCRSRGP